jgi:hypothetical protein
MPKNNRHLRNKKSKKTRRTKGGARTRGDAVHMSREINAGRVQPDRLRVELAYPLMTTLTNNGNSFAARRWTPNGPYDIDPTLGSTSLPGYNEWLAFYTYVVVLRYYYELRISNQESFPVAVYIVNTNTDPGTAGTSYLDYSTQKYGRRYFLSAKGGGDKCVVRGGVEVSQLVGQDITKDVNYRSTVGNNPNVPIYLGLGINAGSSDFTANGVVFDLMLRVQCHFFDRKILTA